MILSQQVSSEDYGKMKIVILEW